MGIMTSGSDLGAGTDTAIHRLTGEFVVPATERSAIRYARSVGAEDAVAVTVAIDEDHAERFRAQWERHRIDYPLEIIESPFRDLTGTVEDYLAELNRRWGHDYLTVVIPEFVLPHWYQGVFHNQSALALKMALRVRKDTVVVNVPYHLAGDRELEAEAKALGIKPSSGAPSDLVELRVPAASEAGDA
ncbi:MAG: hypothetical protein V9E94_02985 [Microthrixaceae bacterium]